MRAAIGLKRLQDVCELFADGDWIETKDQSPSGIRLIQTGNVGNGEFKDRGEKARFVSEATFERLRCTEIFEGDCLVSRLPDPVGRSCLLPKTGERMITAVDCTIIRFKHDLIEPKYFHYFSQSDGYFEQIEKLTTGATRQRISRSNLGTIVLPRPPLPEQQRIVAVLDEAFAGLATATVNAEKNLRNAREVRNSALNLAVVGDLTSKWRQDNSDADRASAHLELVLSRRRQDWKEQGGSYKEPVSPVTSKSIGLPSTWTLASPEQICTHIVDCPHRTPKWTAQGELCLRTTNFLPGILDLESVRFVSGTTYKERIERLEPRPGDIVYSREGGILGVACLIPEGLKACLGQRMMLFRVDSDLILPEFFMGVLNSNLILTEVKRLVGGAASPHLNIRDIRRFPIPVPPIVEQKEIIAKLDMILAETRRLEVHYENKVAALNSMKQSLLLRAFSGELTAPPSQGIKQAAE